MIEAVIFDLDNTIVLSEDLHFKATEQTLAEYGIEVERRKFSETYAGRGSSFIFKDIFKKHGIFEQYKEAKKKKTQRFQEMVQNEKLSTLDGFLPFFKELKQKDIKTTIASGSSLENIQLSLESAGIIEHFPSFFSANALGKSKPLPDVYLAAAESLSVEPGNCLAFEDSHSGIESALAAGLTVIGVTTTLEKDMLLEKGVVRVINSYNDITVEEALSY